MGLGEGGRSALGAAETRRALARNWLNFTVQP